MRKLYRVECFGEFVCELDTDDDEILQAARCLPENSNIDFSITDMVMLECEQDIPKEWKYRVPVNSSEKLDCSDYIEQQNKAENIARLFKEIGYDLSDSFVDDLKTILAKYDKIY